MLVRALLPPFIVMTGLVLVGTLAACTSDDVTAPPGATEGAMTVDASSGWVYVDLADSAVVVPSPSPTARHDHDARYHDAGHNDADARAHGYPASRFAATPAG
jgi:hypothetical protein